MKLQEVTAYNLKSEAILTESQSWEMLTEQQRIYVGSWEKNVWPLVEQYSKLMEADLKPDQIKKIFQDAEKVSIEGGENMTALGKAGKVTAEVSGKMKAEIDKLMDAAANSGPVKNFDAQFEKLKSQLKTKLQGNPAGQKILAGVEKWGGFAKDNPAKSAFIIGAMTSVLAFASGGILSGAAIGFFLKLANNTIKGDKLSTAAAKSVKGAALGAVAGAIGDAIGEILPPEITSTFINDASGEIDVTQLDGMDATSLTDLDADAAKELIQTRSAMAELLGRGDLDAEAQEILQGQMKEVDDKIFALAGEDGGNLNQAIDKMQGEFDIKGTDVDIEKTTSTSTQDADSYQSDTEVVAKLDAEQLNDAGINSADFPDNAWITDNTQKLLDAGLSEEDIEALQNAQGFNRALDQKEFMGTRISASSAYEVGDSISVEGVPEEITVGSTFKSTVSKTLPDGTEYTAIVDSTIEGVDADGNPVFQMKSVFVQPNAFTDNLDKALENLPDDLRDELYDQVFKGTVSGSMEQAVDNTAAQIAQAAAAVALGGALAKSEFKEPTEKKESRVYKTAEQLEDEYFDLFEDYRLDEIDIKGMAKKAAAGAANITKAAAKGAGKVAGAGMDKVGAAANKGIGKAVGAVKSGAAKAGKELGQKVTYAKLEKDWKKAGEPTDVGSIAQILSNRGMSDEQIGTVATNTGQADLKVQGAEKSTASSGGVGGGTKGNNKKAPAPGKNAGAKTGGVGGGTAGAGGATGAGGGAGASASSPDPKADKDGDGKADGDSASTLQGKSSGDPFNDGPFDMKSSPPKGTNAGATKDDYEWKGAQWISKSTGKVADKGTAAKLGNPKIEELVRQIFDANQVDLAIAYIEGGGKAKAPAGGKPAAPGKSAASKRPDQRFQQQPTA